MKLFNMAKKFFSHTFTKVSVGIGSLLGFGVANAALPAGATTAITTLETDWATLETAIWGVLTLVTLGFIYIKLFKKGANKAT